MMEEEPPPLSFPEDEAIDRPEEHPPAGHESSQDQRMNQPFPNPVPPNLPGTSGESRQQKRCKPPQLSIQSNSDTVTVETPSDCLTPDTDFEYDDAWGDMGILKVC